VKQDWGEIVPETVARGYFGTFGSENPSKVYPNLASI